MTEKKATEVIDLTKIVKKLWSERKLFYKVLPITFVVSALIIICVPRTYTSDVKLAPEMGSSMAEGALGSIASSFGFNLGDMQTSDAINPMLYPELMEDNAFVAGLFNIRVKDVDGEIDTDLYTYLRRYQKEAWWSAIFTWLKKLLTPKEEGSGQDTAFDAYYLSKVDDGIVNMIRDMIKISTDKKTGVIAISAKAQDALVAKTVADSVTARLQDFITDYRTNKARIDYNYYKDLAEKSRQEYEEASALYAKAADGNLNVTMKSVEVDHERLANDMEMKLNTYTTICNQLQAAKAKVQERTPAFTILQGAAVPVKASGPKRVLFVLAMLILAFMGTALRVYFRPEKTQNGNV